MSFRVNSAVVAAKVGDEYALLNSETSYYFLLNEIGSLVWECVSNGTEIERIVNEIVALYDVDQLSAREDLMELLAELVSQKILIEF